MSENENYAETLMSKKEMITLAMLPYFNNCMNEHSYETFLNELQSSILVEFEKCYTGLMKI